MRSVDLPQVRTLGLFEGMSDDSFESMMQSAYLQTFPAGLELFSEGDPADFLFVVTEGSVELYATSNGREASMAMVTPVGTFILAAVLKDAVYLMAARTAEKTRLLMIPAENIRQAVEKDPAFARAIIVELASCYRAVVKDHKNLKLRSSVERLANKLLRLNRDQGSRGMVDLPVDKRRLASLLGMTPENLSRAFNTLRPYGVDVDGNMIRLGDLAALERLAKPNPLIDDRMP
jgi:CRP/FNR family transcriptional activator FtrB